ncbi:MAG TPA: FHA domain-containing protein [Polyangiaceae bacterium]|nr:FHA domain-containing protein [Polyangiaceae bacterium]
MSMTSGREIRSTLRGTVDHALDVVVNQASPRPGKAFLMVSTGSGAGTVFPVAQPSVIVGRSLEADVRINEQAISSEHALLEQEEGGFRLSDLGSTNGTYVNGQRLVHPVSLMGGDTIRMGATTFTFITRESGLPKGTVRLRDPSAEVPLPLESQRKRSRERENMAVSSPPSSQQTGSISLTDVVRAARSYWRYAERYGGLVAIGTCFGIAAGLVQLWAVPPPGSAWFEMKLAATNEHSDEQEDLRAFVGAESTFRSLPLIKKTLTRLGAPKVTDAGASSIQDALALEQVGYNSKVYRGDYQDSTATQAVTFLNEHLRVYIDSELDKLLKVLRADADFDREQERQAAERVAEARNKLIAFSDEHPEAVPKDAKLPDQGRIHLAPGASKERIEQAVANTQRALRVAYTQIQTKKAQPYLEKAASLEHQIAEGRARGLLDQHPEQKGLLNLQAAMRSRAASLLGAQPSPSEQMLDPQIVRLKEDLADLESRLGPETAPNTVLAASGAPASTGPAAAAPAPRVPTESLSQLKIQYGELAREYERAKTEDDALLKKREATERQLERERTLAEGRYDIITPPTPVKASMVSAMLKRGGMGGLVGLGLALLAAVALEVRRMLIVRGHI